jgi:hypothetical protein
VCAHCKKVGELDTMKRCGRCRLACYCSVECQKLHWKIGGHKKVCGKVVESGAASDGAGASAPLQHPCPICLDNEDDAGDEGMCNSCGQMFCGSCTKTLVRRIPNCPTCRAPLGCQTRKRFDVCGSCWGCPTSGAPELRSASSGRATRAARESSGMLRRRDGGPSLLLSKVTRKRRVSELSFTGCDDLPYTSKYCPKSVTVHPSSFSDPLWSRPGRCTAMARTRVPHTLQDALPTQRWSLVRTAPRTHRS